MPVVAPETGSITIPDDAKYYSELGTLFGREPFLGADGRLGWFYSRQRSEDDARAVGVAVAAPATGAAGTTPPTGVEFATLAGSSALRGSVGERTAGGSPTHLDAVAGGTWFIDSASTPRPARDRLVQVDDRFKVTRRIVAPRHVYIDAVVPTKLGIRLVGHELTPSDRPSRLRVVISGPGGRGWARDPYLGIPFGKDLDDGPAIRRLRAAALPDGSLLVAGTSRAKAGLPNPVIRVTPKGRITRMPDRRRATAARFTGRLAMVPTRLGIVMDETSTRTDYAYEGATDLKTAVVIRSSSGRVRARKLIRDLDLPRPENCKVAGTVLRLLSVGVGPDGLPVIRVSCRLPQSMNGPYPGPVFEPAPMLVGLAADLSARWWRPAPELRASDYTYEVAQVCGSDTIDGRGRLLSLRCDGTLIATTVPGALPVARGKVTRSTRVNAKTARIRIACKGHYGSVCSGIAQVKVGSSVLGSAAYTLPGRPGGTVAVIDRHITTTAPLPKRFKVALSPGG